MNRARIKGKLKRIYQYGNESTATITVDRLLPWVITEETEATVTLSRPGITMRLPVKYFEQEWERF